MKADRQRDFEKYGTEEYHTALHFYDFPARFTLNNKDFTVTPTTNPVTARHTVINYPDLKRWENEMYNSAFDNFEGTDWDKVIEIEI